MRIGARPGGRRARRGPRAAERPAAVADAGCCWRVEVGALSGFLAARVLGQYEFPCSTRTAPARLLFVGPNLAGAARALERRRARRCCAGWRCTRPRTRCSSRGVPWLREHMAGRGCASCVAGARRRRRPAQAAADADAPTTCGRWSTRSAAASSSRSSPGPERRALLDELQATMALIEGYAEHVMDAVGEPLLPDLPNLRAGARAPPPRAHRPAAPAREADRPGPQAAPVRAGQGVLRRRRRRGRDRGAQPGLGGAGISPHSPRWTTRSAGSRVSAQTRTRVPDHKRSPLVHAVYGRPCDTGCNGCTARVYKQVFAGYSSGNDLELISSHPERG